MQGYLNHFLGNINIVNSPEVCFVHTELKIDDFNHVVEAILPMYTHSFIIVFAQLYIDM